MQKISLLYYKRLFLFFQVIVENKSSLPVFRSNRLRFCSWKFQDDGTAKYFLAKLARCRSFDLLNSISLRLYLLHFSIHIICSKKALYFCFNFFINRILLLVILYSYLRICFKQKIVNWKLFCLQIYRGLWL